MTPSSTSSSELDGRYQTLEPGRRRRVDLGIALACVLVFGSVAGTHHLLAGLLDFNGRPAGLLEHLPQLASDHRDRQKVVVFGSSMTQAAFEPALFDARLDELGLDVVSYNHGVGNLNPEYQEILSRRIREALEQEDETLALTLVELTPFQATLTRSEFTAFTRDQNHALLMTTSELCDVALEDPDRGARLLTIRHVRNGLSAELLTSLPGILYGALSNRDPSPPPELRALEERRREARSRFEALLPAGTSLDTDGWNAGLRGGRLDRARLSAKARTALEDWGAVPANPARMRADLQRRVDQGDILELHFDETQVQAFISLVKNLASVSDTIEVILLPQNTDWVRHGPQARARLDAVLTRITAETGVRVRDLQHDSRFTPRQFVDTTHLSVQEGAETFTTILAEIHADTLRRASDARY
ncbi:MAG: hypothetical protein AAF533_18245 [Acidobacteriota bacterium]